VSLVDRITSDDAAVIGIHFCAVMILLLTLGEIIAAARRRRRDGGRP
jgi:hypothetical protein